MHFFDTHAHLNDPALIDRIGEVLADARNAGVSKIVAIGIDLRSSYQCIELAKSDDGIFASVGVHPNSCHNSNDAQWKEIIQLAKDPNVVALGETGLDCYWDDCPLATQQPWFARHIQLSHETGLPIVVHLRDSEQQILESFEKENLDGSINGIMHSFTGTWETAKRCLDYGMYISFAGMVTFKNAQAIREVAKNVPNDRILIETDSPYLTPHPHRGKKPNHPAMVIHTAECLAQVRGTNLETIAELTTANASRVFQIKNQASA